MDLDSLKSEDVRTAGAWAYEKLQMSHILKECGLNEADIDQAKVLLLGKRIHPGSERETFQWFQHRFYDLTNTYFEGNPCAPEAQQGASKEKRTDRPL
ncbi:MAG: hypothetical protein ACUVR9_13185, partial [Desulfosoma sp.]